MIGAQTSLHPDRAAMRRHLEWLTEPVVEKHPDLRVEIAWSNPDDGPNRANMNSIR